MNPTVSLALALGACFGTFLILRGGWTSKLRTTILGLDPKGIGISALAVIAAWFIFGPVFGMSLIITVVIHEFGHVAAYRVIGHHDASFRLVPLLGGYAISSRAPATQEEQVFVSLMGPAICLAPMVLAFTLIPILGASFPDLIYPLAVFGSVCGALNFLNLLPIWPLDGGRLTSTIFTAINDKAPFYIFATATALIGLMAVLNQRIFLLVIVLMGAQHLISTRGHDGTPPYARMSKRRAYLCLAAWAFTAAAFFWGGLGTLMRYI
ncbi:metalloprotease [Pseudooctadecabacter jejudonensis]|uniref:Peptidase family M50 n=1 Tax=Pseudooctadecabacter jejudonensis TaxID=1391910 RepID=A0A1Y5SP52_9RHOB|nr:site-2 protease family protein [Pseudooctadecabacter jejudonensis]SLN45196.1 Peptidase family M50 [Pseudooctadecabacter jejudonensis]